MDMSLVAKLIDNFDDPSRRRGSLPWDRQLGDFHASMKLDLMSTEKVRKLPTFLDLNNLGMYSHCLSACRLSTLSSPQPVC